MPEPVIYAVYAGTGHGTGHLRLNYASSTAHLRLKYGSSLFQLCFSGSLLMGNNFCVKLHRFQAHKKSLLGREGLFWEVSSGFEPL